MALAAFNPLLIYHAQHDRMYSLLMLCGLTSLWLFHRIVSASAGPAAGTFAALTVANIALVNTHYYGWLLVGLEVCYLLFWLRPHFWRGMFSAALVFLASIPWLWVAARGAMAKGGVESNLGWIPKPDFNEVKWFFRDMAGVVEFQSVAQAAITVMALLVVAAVLPSGAPATAPSYTPRATSRSSPWSRLPPPSPPRACCPVPYGAIDT